MTKIVSHFQQFNPGVRVTKKYEREGNFGAAE